MGERKVVNKYYPPDFDPAKIPQRRQPENHQIKVRMMLPMSIRCKTCGNYIGQGTKFNSRKENVVGEEYLGILVFRFYFKCTTCSAEITCKTDPKNSDYIVESGATRNFEPWRAADEENRRRRSDDEFGDPMRSLENRTLDSKREMDRDAALHELQCLKRKQATNGVDTLLAAMKRAEEEKERKQREEDEAEARLHFRHRIDDDDDDDEDWWEDRVPPSKKQKLGQELARNPTSVQMKPFKRKTGKENARKLTLGSSTVKISAKKKSSSPPTLACKSGLSLIEAYDSEDDD